MEKRTIGQSDLSVSVIGLGCMSLGKDHLENQRIIHKAFDLGVNFFDTADLYDQGFNEESVGRSLKEVRQQVVLASKVGNQWRADGSGWDWNPSKAYIKQAVHQSLRRLQTDYLDLYQLHGGTLDDPTDETIEAFKELKTEGLIRYYGISSIRPNVIRRWTQSSTLQSVMTQYSLLDRRPEEETLEHLATAGVGVIVRGALAKGLLVDKAPTSYLGHDESTIRRLQQQLAEMVGSQSPATLALRYAMSKPAVSTIAVGASSLAQVEENVKAGSP
ncbi:MAG: aldo/keto reductase [Bacteroidota bacterium]